VVDWTEHGAGIFSRRYPFLDLNIGLVICGEGSLVIDTRSHYREARQLQDEVRSLTPAPVRWVVNTHHHWDHTFGNALFLPAPIWGHRRCAEVLLSCGERMRREVQAWAGDDEGLFSEVVITPPDHTFDAAADLVLEGRAIELRHLGRAHTDNDVVVLVPDAGVLFAGDLIEESAPPSFDDSFPLEWPDALSRLVALASGPVIPGHGATVDTAFVAAQQRNLSLVAELALERHATGMTVPQAAAAGGPFSVEVLHTAFARVWPALETGA
jgi:glyoxylase-like metal-dependent hydrolase (beta-lactamase superfamily II)